MCVHESGESSSRKQKTHSNQEIYTCTYIANVYANVAMCAYAFLVREYFKKVETP